MAGIWQGVGRARRAVGGRLMLAVLLGLSLAAHAAPPPSGVHCDVFLGHDGFVREAGWFPLVCELRNDSPSFHGVIEISARGIGRGQARRVEVELPTGTRKRITIPLFGAASGYSAWDVRLRDERGQVRAEQLDLKPRRQLHWQTPVLGALARTADGLPLPRPVLPKRPDLQPAVARWTPDLFPDNPLVLETLDALYLNSEKAAELNPRQARALLTWLRAGGHLVVAVEEAGAVQACAWLHPELPCTVGNRVIVTRHTELQQWLVAPVAPTGDRPAATNVFAGLPAEAAFEAAPLPVTTAARKDGAVLVQAEGHPLLITAPRGQGRITVLLFSPEREPARSWNNLPTFWAKLIEIPPVLYRDPNYQPRNEWSVDGLFGAMIDSRQVRKLPISWLLALLAVYLLVIGPGDRWGLTRLRRPMLTWLTFPGYAVLFTLLIYYLGYKLRAGETEWNELHVVDVLPAGGQAELRGRTFVSIYSPVNTTYPVTARQTIATLRRELRDRWSGAELEERSGIRQTGDNFQAQLFVPVWTSRLYVNDWWEAASPPLTLRLRANAGGWDGTVENRLDQTLTEARLVVAGVVFELGELRAGRPTTFQFTAAQGRALKDFVSSFSQDFQGAVQSRRAAFGRSHWLDNLPADSQAASFAAQLAPLTDPSGRNYITPPGWDLSPVVERGQAVLLAWAAESAPVTPLYQFKPKRIHRNTLYRLAVTVSEAP